MKPLKIVILEFIGECGNWEWYSITRNITPKQAIKNYLKEMNLNKKQKISLDRRDRYYYADEDDVRACELYI